MLKWFLHRYTRGFERRYDYDDTYIREMIDVLPTGFQRFAIMQMAGGEWRAVAPINAWSAAGSAGALVED